MRPLKIGEECAVIKLTPDYMGIWDIISKYATELKLNDVAIRLSQINARFAYAIAAGNQKDAASIKKLLEKLANGEPGLIEILSKTLSCRSFWRPGGRRYLIFIGRSA